MSLPEQKQIAAGSFKLSDGRQAYLAKAKNNFPHVSQLSSKSPPTFDGTPDEFLESFKDESEKKEIAKRLKNKVRKCPNCGKAVAFTLSNCNSCGESLKEVDISYTNNVFTGFAYGVKKGPFPFTISLRYQDEDFMVFDDLLGLSPCHVNVIPTSQYMSDWRFLLKNPAKGLKLINTMHDLCLKVMREQFVSSKEWCEKILPKDAPKGDALERMVLSGFNYPPSQYQLHLQFMLPPLLPFQSFNYEKGLHFTPGRFFPIQYVRALLSLDVVFEVDDDTDINDIIKKAKELGVDYEKIHSEFYKNAGLHQSTLGNWNLNDFESVVVVDKDDKNELFSIEKDGSLKKIESEEDIKSIPNVDKSVLQNYGRPYNEDGKTTGTYYKHAKRKASDMHNW